MIEDVHLLVADVFCALPCNDGNQVDIASIKGPVAMHEGLTCRLACLLDLQCQHLLVSNLSWLHALACQNA